MKTLIKISSLLIVTTVIFMACQKETSFEQGSSTASVGSLSVDASGNCLGAVISGTYMKDTAIKSSNYVDVSVKVDTVGTYVISSDTVNGYYFRGTGSFSATGTQTVRLAGGAKPLAIGTNNFRVTYNGTVCDFTVTVTAPPPPAGGSAVFTVNCGSVTPAGTYMAGTALNATNSVGLNVNVTTVGTWSVTTSTAVNGIIFSGTGTFATTGAQTITLLGSGTPTAAGANTYTVTGGAATCTLQITVTAAAPPDYFPRTANSNWSYQFDDVFDDSLLTKVISPTLTANGKTYNIFMSTYGTTPGFDSTLTDQYASYYRRSGSDYFEWIDMGSYVGMTAPLWMEYTFLKDNQAVGGTWQSAPFTGQIAPPAPAPPFTATLRWEFTIVQQNVNLMVGSTNYTNVIQVKQELKQESTPGVWVLTAYFQSYFARDKGLIKQDLYNATNTLQYKQDVRRLVIY